MRLWGYVIAAYTTTGALYGSYVIHLRRQTRRFDGGTRGRAR